MINRRSVAIGLLLLGALAILGMASPGVRAENITITWWQAWTNDEGRTALINEYSKAFKARYPNVTVEPVYVQWDQLAAKARVAIAGGAPPDVLMVTPGDLAALAYSNGLVPLDGFIAAEKVNLRGFIPADLQKGRYDGKLFGLPHISGGANDFILYHKEIFANSGLPDAAPATWNELQSFAKKLTRSAEGRITQLGYNGFTFIPYLYSNGGGILSSNGRQVTFNTPNAREVFRFFRDLEESMGGGPAVRQFFAGKEGSDENRNFPFYLGQVGMIKGWQANFKNIAVAAPGLPFGVGVMPYNQSNPGAAGHGTSEFAWLYVIPKGVRPERQLAAFRWMAWLTADKAGGAAFPMTMGRPAPWLEINRRREYLDRNPEWLNVIKVLETDIAIPITPVHNEILALIHQAEAQVRGGSVAVDAALDEAARLAQRKLDEAYQR